jgi:hypothetical protein
VGGLHLKCGWSGTEDRHCSESGISVGEGRLLWKCAFKLRCSVLNSQSRMCRTRDSKA